MIYQFKDNSDNMVWIDLKAVKRVEESIGFDEEKLYILHISNDFFSIMPSCHIDEFMSLWIESKS